MTAGKIARLGGTSRVPTGLVSYGISTGMPEQLSLCSADLYGIDDKVPEGSGSGSGPRAAGSAADLEGDKPLWVSWFWTEKGARPFGVGARRAERRRVPRSTPRRFGAGARRAAVPAPWASPWRTASLRVDVWRRRVSQLRSGQSMCGDSLRVHRGGCGRCARRLVWVRFTPLRATTPVAPVESGEPCEEAVDDRNEVEREERREEHAADDGDSEGLA